MAELHLLVGCPAPSITKPTVSLALNGDGCEFRMLILRRLKDLDIIYCHLQANQNSSGLQCKVAYWPALAVGSAAQLAAAHCPL